MAQGKGNTPAWSLGFQNAIPAECPKPTRLEFDGTIPDEIRGTLYRQGPGRFDVYGERQAHWFDGDGLATALRFDDEEVTFVSRFVNTEEKLEEDRQQKRIFGVFGKRPSGNALTRVLRRQGKNVANTNLVPHEGGLWAMYEGGLPIRLDSRTLETRGPEFFGGKLTPTTKVSAHPHRDPKTGDLWNFGLARGKETKLTVYHLSKTGSFRSVHEVVIPVSGIVHDFALTPRWLVFVLNPTYVSKIPLKLLLGQESFAESLVYRPIDGTAVLLIDRETGKTRWHRTDAFFTFHVANSWEEDDEVVVDVCNYDNFDIMTALTEVLVGRSSTSAQCFLERLRIRPNGVVRERLCDTSFEFPRVLEEGWYSPRRRYFGTSWSDRDWVSVPAVIDLRTCESQLAPIDDNLYAGEPVPVPKSDEDLDDVWLIVNVLDVRDERSEVHILDGSDITSPPVARIRLPQRLPFMLHGNWVAAPTSAS